MERLIRLTRVGHEPVDMTVSQITPGSVCRVFSVSKLHYYKLHYNSPAVPVGNNM